MCSKLEPLAVTVLGQLTERNYDEQGCSYLNTARKPLTSLEVVGFAGQRQVLDAMTTDWYELNGDITSVSPRAALSRSPFVSVPGGRAVAHIDCGTEVNYDVILPPSSEDTTHVAQVEALLCT